MTSYQRSALFATAAIICMAMPVQAQAQGQTKSFDVPAQPVASAISALGRQADIQIVAAKKLTRGKTSRAIKGSMTVEQALAAMLGGAGLEARRIGASSFTIVPNPNVGGVPADAAAQPQAAVSSGGEDGLAGQEIVVTGTNIRGANPLSPVITLTSEQLRRQGFTRLDQAIEQLPQNFKAGVSQESNGFTGAGVGAVNNQSFSSGVNLRGLGPGTTLVLLNDRRLALSASGTSADISAIPVSAIDRVEILTDGASATYGSDAIGGVVNIITRDDFEGFETGFRVTGVSAGKNANVGGHVLGGTHWSTGHAVLSADYDKSEPLLASRRDFSRAAPAPAYLLPERSSWALFGSAKQDIGSSITVDLDGTYSRRTFRNLQNVPAGAGLQTADGDARQLNIALGAEVRLSPDWAISFSGQYGRNKETVNTAYEAFPQFGSTATYSYSIPSAEIRLNGRLPDLLGRSVRLAAGAMIRDERDTQLTNGVAAVKARRTVKSLYAEALVELVNEADAVPLIRSLKFDAAVRYDNYSDFGSTTNPKFSARWELDRNLSLTASYGTSFRAPSFFELTAVQSGYVFAVADPSSTTGTRTALLFDGGNPGLSAENSSNFNLGLAYNPPFLAGATLKVGYFSIDYDDRIIRLISQGYFTNVVTSAGELGSLVNLTPSVAQVNAALASIRPENLFSYVGDYLPSDIRAIANIGYVNAAQSRIRGFDIAADYRRQFGEHGISASATASIFDRYSQSATASAASASILNRIYSPLRFRASWNLGWEYRGFSVNGRLSHSNAYRNGNDPSCGNASGCRVSAWNTVDLSLAYRSGEQGPLGGLRIALDITNLFDEPPPYAPAPGGLLFYDPTNANPLGRYAAISITKSW